jgi:hypothetical protein
MIEWRRILLCTVPRLNFPPPPPPPSLRRQALTLTALAGEGLPQRNDNFLLEIS